MSIFILLQLKSHTFNKDSQKAYSLLLRLDKKLNLPLLVPELLVASELELDAVDTCLRQLRRIIKLKTIKTITSSTTTLTTRTTTTLLYKQY